MITIAAAADVHFGEDTVGTLREHQAALEDSAGAFLLAGDLTNFGYVDEARLLAKELKGFRIPIVAVLGNHDYHMDEPVEIRTVLEGAGVTVLEGESTVMEAGGVRLGVAGVKGFCGGFLGASGAEFGEPEMKNFIAHTRDRAAALESILETLEADVKIALLHYSPIEETLRGERPEVYPFLGSYLLAEAIDRAGAHLVLHGHAHAGREKGFTTGGVPVRNVSQPVIRRPYALYRIAESGVGESS